MKTSIEPSQYGRQLIDFRCVLKVHMCMYASFAAFNINLQVWIEAIRCRLGFTVASHRRSRFTNKIHFQSNTLNERRYLGHSYNFNFLKYHCKSEFLIKTNDFLILISDYSSLNVGVCVLNFDWKMRSSI